MGDTPEPSATGVFRGPAAGHAPWWFSPWGLVAMLLLGGGGSGFIGAGIARGDDTSGAAAMARVESVEKQLKDTNSRLSSVETEQQRMSQTMREQTRYLRWIASMLRSQTGALQKLGTAQGIALDLTVDPMLPEPPGDR